MSSTTARIAEKVCGSCRVGRCHKEGCRVDLEGAPSDRIIVDMDCDALQFSQAQKRCDYLFVGEEHTATCVAPIELKSGRVDAGAVLEQLEGGAGMAETWLPQGASFRFVPILAHGKKIHPNDQKRLSRPLTLRGQRRKVERIKCGEALVKALRA